jgi:hypothetical protein
MQNNQFHTLPQQEELSLFAVNEALSLVNSLRNKQLTYSEFVTQFRKLFFTFISENPTKNLTELINQFQTSIGVAFKPDFWAQITTPPQSEVLYESTDRVDQLSIQYAERSLKPQDTPTHAVIHYSGKIRALVLPIQESNPL